MKTTAPIPPLDLAEEYRELAPALKERIERVLSSGHMVLDREVEEFEERFARFCGAKHVIGVASGTDALLLALMGIGIKPGDEVITPSWTFIAAVWAILRLGAKPRFVDIEYLSFNMNPALLEEALTPKTKAVLPVHIYGFPAAMDEISSFARRHKLEIIEDCAQANGAKVNGTPVGLFGAFGAFSFYPTKNLGAYGDAGALITDDSKRARKIKELRIHGAQEKYVFDDQIGINSRLDEIQAAILNVKLDYLERWNLARKSQAAYYSEQLGSLNFSGIVLPSISAGAEHVFHLYTIRVPERDQILKFLNNRGIAAGIYYPKPVHLQKAYLKLGFEKVSLPETERAAREVISLPLFPQITRSQQDCVIQALSEYFQR